MLYPHNHNICSGILKEVNWKGFTLMTSMEENCSTNYFRRRRKWETFRSDVNLKLFKMIFWKFVIFLASLGQQMNEINIHEKHSFHRLYFPGKVGIRQFTDPIKSFHEMFDAEMWNIWWYLWREQNEELRYFDWYGIFLVGFFNWLYQTMCPRNGSQSLQFDLIS